MDLNLLPYTDFSIALRMLDAFSRGVNISKKKKKRKREKLEIALSKNSEKSLSFR